MFVLFNPGAAGPSCNTRNGRDELGRVDGFGDMDQKAGAQRPRPVFGAGKSGERDCRQCFRPSRVQAPAPAGGARSRRRPACRCRSRAHAVFPFRHERQRLSGGAGGEYFRAAFFEHPLDQIARVRFVVDHQHFDSGEVRVLEVPGRRPLGVFG